MRWVNHTLMCSSRTGDVYSFSGGQCGVTQRYVDLRLAFAQLLPTLTTSTHKTSDRIFGESWEAEPELIRHINPLFFSTRRAEGNGSLFDTSDVLWRN